MNDKQIDELIDRALSEEQKLPEGLQERLEQYIDTLAGRERQPEKKRSFSVRRSFYLAASVAAALLIGVAIFFQTETARRPAVMADTFSDPQEAAIVAHQALAYMSTQLNKGLAPVAGAGKEIDKVNEILSKPFNE
jgi:anti-sigma-K factor RskA